MTTVHTPYAGTSGWSGSDTSEERARHADASGETEDRQQLTLRALRSAADKGLTYQELGSIFGWHHGKSSGALSVLHKVGEIARLTERRNKCLVYVLPEHVHGRPVGSHGRRNPTGDALTAWLRKDATGASRADIDPRGFVRLMREVTGIGVT